MTAYRYKIFNKYNEPLDLTSNKFAAGIPSVQRNYALIPRLEQGGTVLQGDGQVKGRKLPLKFDYVGAGETIEEKIQDVYYILNVIGGYFRIQDAPFYAHNLDRNVRCRVYANFAPAHMAGLEYVFLQKSVIDFEMLDSAWEDIDPVNVPSQMLEEDGEMEIDIPIYTEDIFPIVNITANSDSPKIFSLSTGRDNFSIFRYILINELTFFPGSIISLDSVTGRAYINGNLNMDMITAGYFLKFDRRNTKLRWNSSDGNGSVSVSFSYRNRSLYG